MPDLIEKKSYAEMPWKNGHGITREIASEQVNSSMLWRLSLADVQCDGPFSIFPDTERLLTVVSGKGMDLHSPDQTFFARPLSPLRFPGDVPVDGVCIDGPVQNFNLIFDPNQIDAEVSLIEGQVKTGPTRPTRVALYGIVGADFRYGQRGVKCRRYRHF